MVRKIAVAAEARTSPDFLIIARTDARTSKGLPEAIHRARTYAEAGADMLFIELPESEDELVTIGRELGDKPLMANMVEGGTHAPIEQCAPGRDRLCARHPSDRGHPQRRRGAGDGLSADPRHRLVARLNARRVYSFAEMNRLMGLEEVLRFDQAHAES